MTGRSWPSGLSGDRRGFAYARRIWRIHADGSKAQPITGLPPAGYSRGGYYGFDPIEWTPDERVLLAGLTSEWGPEAIRVDVATGAFRKLSGYAVDLSRNGRFVLVDSGGSEGPQTIAAGVEERSPPRCAEDDAATHGDGEAEEDDR